MKHQNIIQSYHHRFLFLIDSPRPQHPFQENTVNTLPFYLFFTCVQTLKFSFLNSRMLLNPKLKIFILSSNQTLFQFLTRNWSYTFLIHVQAFWCSTNEVRQQGIIISTFDLSEPSFSFSQDSYWAALWRILFTYTGFPL